MSSLRIVLFGKDGQVGHELGPMLASLGQVFALGRADVDLGNPSAVQTVLTNLKPDLIINAAAYTNVDLAETQVSTAYAVNALAPGIMAETARTLGAFFLHYSTDYVFDGQSQSPYSETFATNPLNVYGQSKLTGELNIMQAGNACVILRTSWVYSLTGNTFVNKVLYWARNQSTLRIVDDQIGNPTWARMLAEVTTMLVATHPSDLLDFFQARRGIYHVASAGFTSRFAWAQAILANDPRPGEHRVQTLEPARSEDFPTQALRPRFSALDCSKFTNTFQIDLPPWETLLRTALHD